MKKILKWVGISVAVFVLLVGVIFAILSFTNPVGADVPEEPDSMESSESGTAASSHDSGTEVRPKVSKVDSLQADIDSLQTQLFFSKLVGDSLNEELSVKNSRIVALEKEIGALNQKILSDNQREVTVKELAKTYETMKPDEMRPILSKIDDETVISIYRNMSSRMRKNLFMALSDERAALITERLASSWGKAKE